MNCDEKSLKASYREFPNDIKWVVCSTPHALSSDALSPRTISPRALSPNGPRNILKNQASQVEIFN